MRLLNLALAVPSLAAVLPNQPVLSQDGLSKPDAIKEAFQHAWDGYTKYAFPHDELYPISNGHGDSRNGWGASAVDALSTAILMRKSDVVNQILDHIATIDYSSTSSSVSLFETTIRYLAGMLSGYDLLKGPMSDLVGDSTKVDTLLDQSLKLAEVLKFGFDTPSGVPHNDFDIVKKKFDSYTYNGLAAAGTLVLEWTRLSDLTGNQEYARLSQKAQEYLLHPQPASSEPFPGLVGHNIDLTSGNFTDGSVSWNGGSDSFYEYLIKMYVYDPKRFGFYKERWLQAAHSTIKHLQSHPSSQPNLTFLASYDKGKYDLSSGHLTCFDGGSFLLGGTVLDDQELVQFGLDLVRGCHATYASTATKIGPESFGWDPDSVPSNQREFYEKSGFYIKNGGYILRPEVMESFYYAYRVTGEEQYRDWVWDAFVAINATCRTESGFAGINNVNAKDGGGKMDNQESFIFAEVLKYAYMAVAGDDEWQVQPGHGNRFVLNTEAHPIRVYE